MTEANRICSAYYARPCKILIFGACTSLPGYFPQMRGFRLRIPPLEEIHAFSTLWSKSCSSSPGGTASSSSSSPSLANPCGWQQVVAHTLSHPSVCFKPGKHYQPSARPARH